MFAHWPDSPAREREVSGVLASLFLEVGLSLHSQVPCACRDGFDFWRWDITETRNPYGSAAIGFEHEFSPRFSARFYVRHESAITVNDYGTDSAGAAITWRPFK